MADTEPPRLRRVRAVDVSAETAQSSGMGRFAAISGRLTGSRGLFMGETRMWPGMVSGNHHHGATETAIYIVAGHPRFVCLVDGKEEAIDTEPGDYLYVPPNTAHREENPGPEEAVIVIARTTDEAIVVNLEQLDDPV